MPLKPSPKLLLKVSLNLRSKLTFTYYVKRPQNAPKTVPKLPLKMPLKVPLKLSLTYYVKRPRSATETVPRTSFESANESANYTPHKMFSNCRPSWYLFLMSKFPKMPPQLLFIYILG